MALLRGMTLRMAVDKVISAPGRPRAPLPFTVLNRGAAVLGGTHA